jgi:hypothetical protein
MADCTTSDLYSICADVTGPADNHCIKQSCTSSLDCLGKSTNNGYGPSGYNSLSFSLCDSATNLCKENSCRYDSDCPTGYVCDTSYQTSSDLTYPHVCQLLKTASGCPAGSGDMTISLTSGKKTICYYPLPQTSCNHNWHLVDVNIGNGKTLKYCTGDCQVGTAIDYTFNLIDANGESIKICAE